MFTEEVLQAGESIVLNVYSKGSSACLGKLEIVYCM